MSQATPPPANGLNNAVSSDPSKNSEKKAEDSGGIFGGLFDSTPPEPATTSTPGVTANQAEGSDVEVEKDKENESGGLFSGLLGSDDEKDKTKTDQNGADAAAKD